MQTVLDLLEQATAEIDLSPGTEPGLLLERVHRAYLHEALGLSGGEAVGEAQRSILRRLALALDAEVLDGQTTDDQRHQDSIYVAATIFELLGRYEEGRGADPRPGVSLTARL